jgi:hypothetical protein
MSDGNGLIQYQGDYDVIEYADKHDSGYGDRISSDDVRDVVNQSRRSRDVVEYDDSPSLREVVRRSKQQVQDRAEERAARELGPGQSLKRHFDTLPAGVRADIRALDTWRSYYEPVNWYTHLCHQNGTNLPAALKTVKALEDQWQADPSSAIASMCQRTGIDPRALAYIFYQRCYNPQAWAANQVSNAEYRRGAGDMSNMMIGNQMQSEIAAFSQANPDFEHFRADVIAELESGRIPNGGTYTQMLSQAYNNVLRAARGKAAAIAKGRAKHVGGAPSSNRRGGSAMGGSSTTDAIVEAINAQRGTV